MDYGNKIALVTGANSGIGEATAHRLAARGCTVIVNGRREAENQRVVADLQSQHGVKVEAWTGDVADEGDCLRMVDKVFGDHGRLDLLVNNAGIGVSGGRVAEDPTEQFERVMKTNLYSAYWLSREVFRRMESQAIAEDSGLRGAIINIASILGVQAWAGTGVYAASKHAMMGLTRAMAEEGEKAGIRVSAVCPAMVATPMTGKTGSDYIQPEDIAASVTYLLELSPAAWPTEIVIPRRGSS